MTTTPDADPRPARVRDWAQAVLDNSSRLGKYAMCVAWAHYNHFGYKQGTENYARAHMGGDYLARRAGILTGEANARAARKELVDAGLLVAVGCSTCARLPVGPDNPDGCKGGARHSQWYEARIPQKVLPAGPRGTEESPTCPGCGEPMAGVRRIDGSMKYACAWARGGECRADDSPPTVGVF